MLNKFKIQRSPGTEVLIHSCQDNEEASPKGIFFEQLKVELDLIHELFPLFFLKSLLINERVLEAEVHLFAHSPIFVVFGRLAITVVFFFEDEAALRNVSGVV